MRAVIFLLALAVSTACCQARTGLERTRSITTHLPPIWAMPYSYDLTIPNSF